VQVATHGAVALEPVPLGAKPSGGPWSLVLPVTDETGATALLLLDAGNGLPLPIEQRSLAAAAANVVAQLAGQARLADELAGTRQLVARADRLSALGLLAASVSHEIRNPLVSVRTFIQLLPERLADEEFRTAFRDLALSEIERICALINDLLAFSRPAPARRERTDLNELVGQIVRLLEVESRRRDVELTWRSEPGLPAVVVDNSQVKQVFMNVILNAIEASGGHGSVAVATRTQESTAGQWCVVSVADSGSGIAPEHVEQIFEPFFTTKDAGNGLGLFIARQIVIGHGGYIDTAPRPGGGTEFSIHFPAQSAGEGADAEAP
jgi:signal transduction histidine kinase